MGAYGWYEALDYTPARLPEQQLGRDGAHVHGAPPGHERWWRSATRCATPRCAGASIAIRWWRLPSCCCRNGPPQHRRDAHARQPEPPPRQLGIVPPTARVFHGPRLSTPTAHLLSNGRYSVMLTAAAAGYSRREGLDVTRWREDPTCDCWGTFFFLRDTSSGAVWSAGLQPRRSSARSLRGHVLRRPRALRAAGRGRSKPSWRSSSLRRTTPRAAASRSATTGRARASWSSRPTPRWCSRRLRPMQPIRRF